MNDKKTRIALQIVHELLTSNVAQLWGEHCSGGGRLFKDGQPDPAETDVGIPTIKEAAAQMPIVYPQSIQCVGDDMIVTACMAFDNAAYARMRKRLRRLPGGREVAIQAIEDVAFIVRWSDGARVDAESLAPRWFCV